MPIAPVLGEFDYTLKGDDTGTVFRLRTLTMKEREDIERIEVQIRGGAQVQIVDQLGMARKILNAGLVGWSDFKDANGNAITFRRVDNGTKQVIPPEIMDLIQNWVIELANAITDRTAVSENNAKNS